MAKPSQPDDAAKDSAESDQSPYASIVVNRGALPEGFFFWRRWRQPKPA